MGMKTKPSICLTDLRLKSNFIVLESNIENHLHSLVFFDPIDILSTYQLREIPSIFNEIEHHLATGAYLAGYITYEAGYVFEEKFYQQFKHITFPYPLIWFGVYEKPYCLSDNEFIKQDSSYPIGNNEQYYITDPEIHISLENYKQKIQTIKDHIRSGDIYQINLTTKAHFRFSGCPFDFYTKLKKEQQVKYAAFIKTARGYYISLSPELFFIREGNTITTKPMKGTLEKDQSDPASEVNIKKLYTSEKDRAENVMIVDLLRNDLNRIAIPCSVKVEKLFEIEEYKTLYQMITTIIADLPQNLSHYELFKALFPCGSITGAPKISSMELIKALEKENRGIYTGSIGYISPGNKAVFNVAIRTLEIQQNKGCIGIGGGITWLSDANNEYKECLQKMKFLKNTVHTDFRIMESLLVSQNDLHYFTEHLNRMEESAQCFAFNYNRNAIKEETLYYVQNHMDQNKDYKLRLLLDKQGNLQIESDEIIHGQNTLKVALSKDKVNSSNIFLYHKTTHRDFYEYKLKQAKDHGFDDLIFRNEKEELTETCRNNLFIKGKETILTPMVSSGLLNGIMRQILLRDDNKYREGKLYQKDLLSAEAIYVSNSVRKLREVVFYNQEI